MGTKDYSYERGYARHAPSKNRGRGLCGARGLKIGILTGNPLVPYYKPNSVTCERCIAKLAKVGISIPKTKHKMRPTVTFSELRRLSMACKTEGLYQIGTRRQRDVGIGFVDEGPADGSETLVIEDNGTLPPLDLAKEEV